MKLNLTPDMFLPCIYAFFASFGFSYVFNLRGKNMFYAALGGGLSWFVYLLFAGCFSSDVPQFFLSMVAVSLYSEYMARKHHSPVTVYLVISYIPLVPGGGAYYTMEYLVGGETQLAMETGIHTLFVAGAIAMGIVLVSSMTRILAAYGRRRREKQESSESA